jgi:hypothetical protein
MNIIEGWGTTKQKKKKKKGLKGFQIFYTHFRFLKMARGLEKWDTIAST